MRHYLEREIQAAAALRTSARERERDSWPGSLLPNWELLNRPRQISQTPRLLPCVYTCRYTHTRTRLQPLSTISGSLSVSRRGRGCFFFALLRPPVEDGLMRCAKIHSLELCDSCFKDTGAM